MNGIIDVGGGMRGIYGAGVFDRLLEDGIVFDYCCGVSAGSANIASYAADQPGRNYRFFTEYSERKEYMGIGNFLKNGNYFNLDFVYSVLSNSDGEYPLDFERMTQYPGKIVTVATLARDGSPAYFTLGDYAKDDYSVVKASCAIPCVCRPVAVGDEEYYDGGLSDPLPIGKALADGVDRLVIVLTKPREERMKLLGHLWLTDRLLGGKKEVSREVAGRADIYNYCLDAAEKLVSEGKALIIAPEDTCGVTTYKHKKKNMDALYNLGFRDGGRIREFLEKE